MFDWQPVAQQAEQGKCCGEDVCATWDLPRGPQQVQSAHLPMHLPSSLAGQEEAPEWLDCWNRKGQGWGVLMV